MKISLIFQLIRNKKIKLISWNKGEYFVATFMLAESTICGEFHSSSKLYTRTICINTDFMLDLDTWEFLEEEDNKYWKLFFLGD